jgi:hypothetical protein
MSLFRRLVIHDAVNITCITDRKVLAGVPSDHQRRLSSLKMSRLRMKDLVHLEFTNTLSNPPPAWNEASCCSSSNAACASTSSSACLF